MRRIVLLALLWPLAALAQFTIPQHTGATASSSPPPATIAYVQDAECSAASATSVTCPFASNVIAGDVTMIVISATNTGGTTYTLGASDNLNGAWIQDGSTCGAGSFSANGALFYFPNSAGGAMTVTATSSVSTDNLRISIIEYSGIAKTSPVDVAATCVEQSGTSIPTPDVTTTNANDLILAMPNTRSSPGAVTVASPYTLRLSGDDTLASGFGEQIVSSTGTYTGATFTIAFGSYALPFTATFKAAP